MMDRELKEIWKNSPETEKIKFDLSRLMIDLNNKMNMLEKAIVKRDIREIAASAIAIPVFAFLAYEVPFPITKIGFILSIAGFIWYIFKLRNNKKKKHAILMTSSFKEQLQLQNKNMNQEAHLLNTVAYWYLLPSFIPYTIWVLGLGDPAGYEWSNIIADNLLPLSFTYKLTLILLAAVIYSGIFWLNKLVVKKTLLPIIDDIEQVQFELKNDR